MKSFLTPLACGTFLVALAAIPACAAPQQQGQTSQQSQPPAQTGQQTQSSSPAQPNSTAPTASTTQSGSTTQQKQAPVNSSVPPPPPPPDQTAPATPTGAQKTAQPGSDAPLPQQDAPNVKPGSKQDVNAIGNRNVGKGGINFYSLEHEIALGKSLAQEVERTSKLVDDPVIVEYVNRVGQNLVRNSDAKVPFTIKVIDSDEVNAFALPGGFFYVNSGLILRADRKTELAGVMAHEIAHVAARHGTKNATKGELMQLATIPLILLGPAGGRVTGSTKALQFAIPMAFLKFSRDAEREADYLGLQYMYKAGYDPNAFVTFFEKILAEEKRQPGHDPEVFLHASAHAGAHS